MWRRGRGLKRGDFEKVRCKLKDGDWNDLWRGDGIVMLLASRVRSPVRGLRGYCKEDLQDDKFLGWESLNNRYCPS